jgi:hypothetical protein
MDGIALPAPIVTRSFRERISGIRVLLALSVTNVINGILDALGNNVSFAKATVYVKLHIGAPGTSGANNAAANTTRQLASFGTPSAGSMTTDADILWSNVPNAETYSHISLWDASTAGNFLGEQALAASKTVAVGDNFRIPTGSLTISGS